MSVYKKVIVAVDLEDDCSSVMKRAVSLGIPAENLALVHVYEPMPAPYASVIPYAPGLAANEDMELQVQTNQAEKLNALAADFGVPRTHCVVRQGYPAKEIKAHADEIDADLIIIGSHGRHGLGLVLGSTANGVLHGACCDVLAVRIGKNS